MEFDVENSILVRTIHVHTLSPCKMHSVALQIKYFIVGRDNFP